MKSSVRFMLTITALVGAILFAGPVGAQPWSFLPLQENVDGVVLTNSNITAVTAVVGAIPGTSLLEDGEDGWVNTSDGSLSNPGIFGNKSVLKHARNVISGQSGAAIVNPSNNAIIANIQPGDTIIAAAIAQGVTAASLTQVVNGTLQPSAATGLLQMVTADFTANDGNNAGLASILVAGSTSGIPSKLASVYPNYVTSAYTIANSTVALYVWYGPNGLTNVAGETIPAGSFVVAATAQSTTVYGNLISVAVVGGVTGHSGTNRYSNAVGVDVDGPTFVANSEIVYATEVSGANVKQMYPNYRIAGAGAGSALINHVTNDDIVEFRASDLVVFGVSVTTNCDKDGEPNAYFGGDATFGTDPLNAAKGTDLILTADPSGSNGIITSASVTPKSVVVEMQNDLSNLVSGWALNPQPTFLGNQFKMLDGAGQNTSTISGSSVVVSVSSSLKTNNNDGRAFYSPQVVLQASFVVKDVSTPRQQDYGDLKATFYIGDELGLSAATTIASSTHGKSTSVTRRVDTRYPYVGAVLLSNYGVSSLKSPNSTANYYLPAMVGSTTPNNTTLTVQLNVDMNGDGLSNAQKQYIATVTDVIGLVTGTYPNLMAGAVQMLVSNSSIPNGFFTVDGSSSSSSYNTVTTPAGQSQTIFGASFTTFLGFDTNLGARAQSAAGWDVYNASLVFNVTDDARNMTSFGTFGVTEPITANVPLADGALNGYPRAATFAIDIVSADVLVSNVGLTGFASSFGFKSPDKIVPLFSKADGYPGNPYATNYGGANIRLVTYTSSGANMEMTVVWNAQRDGQGIDDTLAKSSVLALAANTSGNDKVKITNGEGPFSLGLVLTATNATPINRTISYTVSSSTAAQISGTVTAVTSVMTFTLPTDLFSSITDANERTGRQAWIPGGIEDASFLVKITDKVGNFDGGANITEYNANNSSSNTKNDFSNNINIQTDPPEVVGTIASNSQIARTTSTTFNDVVVYVTSGINFPATVVSATGTSADFAVIHPVFGLQAPYTNSFHKNAGLVQLVTTASGNDPKQIALFANGQQYAWESVKAGEYIIVSATVVPPYVAGWTREVNTNYVADSLNNVTAGLYTPIADYYTSGSAAGVPNSATIDAVSNLITADFSDFVTTANAVVPIASMVVAADGTRYTDYIGEATKDEIVIVTFAVKVDSANLNSTLGANAVRLVTVTAQSPMGPKTSVGIYAATKTAFAAHQVSIESFKYGKTSSTLQPISAATVGSASVGQNHVLQVVAKVLLNGVNPNATNGTPKNFLGLNVTDFYGGSTADVQPDSVQCVLANGSLDNVGTGTASSQFEALVAGATPIYATWTYTLTNSTVASLVNSSASLTVGATTSGGLKSATSTSTLGDGGALAGKLQSDLHRPEVTGITLVEKTINNSKTTGANVDTLSDGVVRIKDTVWAIVSMQRDSADMVNSNRDVVDGNGNLLASSLINYVSLGIANFVGVDFGSATFQYTDANTLQATIPLTIRADNPQGNKFSIVVNATAVDLVGNSFGPSSNSGSLFFENTPPAILASNIGLSVTQAEIVLGPSTMTSSLELDNSNGVPGIASIIHSITEGSGHQEAISPGDMVRVTAVVAAGENYVDFPSGTGIVTADLSQFGFSRFQEPNTKTGDTTIQATWTVFIPSSVTSVPYNTGASVALSVTDSAQVSSSKQDDATIAVDADAPALSGKVEFRRGDGTLVTTGPVSGISTSTNYASMAIQLRADYTQPDFGSTSWSSGGNPINVTNVIHIDASDFGYAIREVTPTYLQLSGSGQTVSTTSAIADVRKSTNSILTANYGGLAANFATPNATLGYSAPGFPVRSTASSKAAPSLIIKVSDRVGNFSNLTGTIPGVDNDAPTFPVKTVKPTDSAVQRVKSGGTVTVEFTVQDPTNNTKPITVKVVGDDLKASAASILSYSGLDEAPTIAAETTGSATYVISNIKPIDASTPGAVTMSMTVSSNATSGAVKYVTFIGTDNINLTSARTTSSNSVAVDILGPKLVANNRYKVINKNAVPIDAPSNLTLIGDNDAPSVAPGDILFVSHFYRTDSIATLTTDIASKLNIAPSTRINSSEIGYSSRQIETNSAFASGTYATALYGVENLWWVTVTIPILSTADPIQPQSYNVDTTDAAGNTNQKSNDLGVNAVGVVVNTADISITANPNGAGSNGGVGGVGGIGPNGPDAVNSSVENELTTGDRLTATAELSVFDQGTPIDKYLVLDVSALYPPALAGSAANVVPTATGTDPISGIFTASWTKAIRDFDGSGTNVKAVTFQALVGSGANRVPPNFNAISGVAANSFGLVVKNGISSTTTTDPTLDSNGNVSVQGPTGTNWTIVGAPNIAVQPAAEPDKATSDYGTDAASGGAVKPVTRAAITVIAQDTEADKFPEATFAAGYVTIDTQRPYGVYTLEGVFANTLPSGSVIQLETTGNNIGYPITRNNENPGYTNTPNRVSSRDKVRANISWVNPLIRTTGDAVGDGDDGALVGSTIGTVTQTLTDLRMDLSSFAGPGFESTLSTNPGRAAGPVVAGSATLWMASWTVNVSDLYGKTVSDGQTVRDVTFFFQDDVQNKVKMTKLSKTLAIDNLAPSISQSGLLATLRQGSFTKPNNTTVTTPGTAIDNGSRISGSVAATSVIIRVSAPITESIDNPNDVLRNQFGDVALTVQDDDPAKLFSIPASNIQISFTNSSVAQNVLFAIFDVTMPLAIDTVGTSSFKFVVSATDSVGNPTTVVTTPSFAFDGRPSLVADTTADPIKIEAGSSKVITFTAFDQGGVADISITPVTDALSDEVTFVEGTLSGSGSTEKTRTKTLTVNTVANTLTTVGADTGPFIISATATDNDPLTVSLSPSLNVAINQPVITAGVMSPVTGVVYEGESLVINVSGIDANTADNISLAISGTLFSSTGTIGLVTFNTPALVGSASTSSISGTGGLIDGRIVFNPNYEVIPPYVSGSVGNATQVGYTVTVTGADGSSNDPDSALIFDVTVTQKTPQPTLAIKSIKVDGVTKTAPGGSININEGSTIVVEVEGTDTSGGLITLSSTNFNNAPYTFTSTPAVGYATGTLSYTAGFNDAGASFDPFTSQFKASVPSDSNEDGTIDANDEPAAAYQVLLVNIDNVSQPPVFKVTRDGQTVVLDATQTVSINQTIEYVANLSDVDNDFLGIINAELIPPVAGVTVTRNPETIAGIGSATGTITVTIGSLVSNASTNLVLTGQAQTDVVKKYIGLVITTGANLPVLTVTPAALSVTKGSSAVFDISVTDLDGDTITLSDGGAGGTFTNQTQVGTTTTAKYNFTSAIAGTFNITITATAGTDTDTEPITVTVTDLPAGVNEVKAGIAVGSGIGGLADQARFQIFSPTGASFDGVPGSYVVSNATTQLFATAGDVNNDNVDEVIFGNSRRDTNSPSIPAGIVAAFNSKTRAQISSMVPFPPAPFTTDFDYNPTGEIRVAAGNLFGDAADEIVIAQGPNAQSRLRIASLVSGAIENNKANTYRPLFLGNPAEGVNIACGDIDGDGFDEIIAGMAGPNSFSDVAQIQIMKITGSSGTTVTSVSISDFKQATFGTGTNPSGGIRVACGDINGDGKDEVVVVSAAVGSTNGGNRLAILTPNASPMTANPPFSVMTDGGGGQISHGIMSSTSNPTGSLYVSCVDIDNDGKDEIVVGRGEGAANEFVVYKIDLTKSGLAVFVQQGNINPTFSGNTGFGTAVGAGMYGR